VLIHGPLAVLPPPGLQACSINPLVKNAGVLVWAWQVQIPLLTWLVYHQAQQLHAVPKLS